MRTFGELEELMKTGIVFARLLNGISSQDQ